MQWPVEYRTLAGDDVWLSPAYGRATVTISVHEDAPRPYERAVRDCEAVFRAHDGRPHWGKIHSPARRPTSHPSTSTGTTSGGSRAELDPEGRFLNAASAHDRRRRADELLRGIGGQRQVVHSSCGAAPIDR